MDQFNQPSRQLATQKKSTTPVLDNFGRDLVAAAKLNQLDPVVGRDAETERCMQTLIRKGKNNPILIGEAGVGKTAIAEGLAQRIARGDVPPEMVNSRVIALDIALMIAGTKYRGEFEERIQAVLKEARQNKDVILFIDEIHTIIGAGSGGGSLDLSNILKPALARGEIKCIGATTLDEYRKYFEKDAALERRFQPILVNPPDAAATEKICQAVCRKLEQHHKTAYSQAVIKEAVRLAGQYIHGRHFPDKVIDLLDEAGSRAQIAKEGEVSLDRIYQVASQISGVPLARLTQSEAARILHLEEQLNKRVIGQPDAIKEIARAIRVSKAGMKDPNRPIGSFLFMGPTGVGKTETVKALAEFLFGDDASYVALDMSEYMEKHNVSKLVGAPPGYAGYEEGGLLTDRVRKKPYTIVLLDEVEKAHPDVFNLLLQVLEEGRLTDSLGREVDFTNTIIVMTSNLGAQAAQQPAFGFRSRSDNKAEHEVLSNSMKQAAEQFFRPEFINRIDSIVTFDKLKRESLEVIVDLEIKKVQKLAREQGCYFELTPEAKELVLEKGYNPDYGARPLKRALQSLVVDPLAEELLAGNVRKNEPIIVDRDGDKLVFRAVPLPKIEPSRELAQAA